MYETNSCCLRSYHDEATLSIQNRYNFNGNHSNSINFFKHSMLCRIYLEKLQLWLCSRTLVMSQSLKVKV